MALNFEALSKIGLMNLVVLKTTNWTSSNYTLKLYITFVPVIRTSKHFWLSVAASGNTSWVYNHSLVSYALEQPEMLRSPDYRHKCDV